MHPFTVYAADGEVVYRMMRSAEGIDLRSGYERGDPPRGRQRINTLIHMGLSCWVVEEELRAKNEQFGGKLGDRLMVLELRAGIGIWIATTFSLLHRTVWGTPEALADCVGEIHDV
jgi:hypothetical protein